MPAPPPSPQPPPPRFHEGAEVMGRAIELAARGIGSVEPNPAVGAVLVDNDLNLIAEGWHARFGGPHAEIEAIARAGDRARGATMFVTLEPCCHQGKTGPCTEAVLRAGIRKVVVAVQDPFSDILGKGIERLRSQGVEVELGLRADEAARLIAPFNKLVTTSRPWIHAKWAMSLDGKIATHTGDSRWISNDASRAIVHRLRGRMDAILVGKGTVLTDDPLLTARPPGPRVATRIVAASDALLPVTSQLVQTARDVPLLIAASDTALPEDVRLMEIHGAEVLLLPQPQDAVTIGEADDRSMGDAPVEGTFGQVDLECLLDELGRRQFTNVLVEGGSRVLGSFFDGGLVDEVHVFVAPKIVGGRGAPTAVAGLGQSHVELAARLDSVRVERAQEDVYINGRLLPD